MTNAKIKTTHAVYVHDDTCGNPYRLTPYVNEDGEIWLASEGNGCADNVVLLDVEGLTDDDIAFQYGDLDLDAMRADAEEIRAAGDTENADWLVGWIERVSAVCHPSANACGEVV